METDWKKSSWNWRCCRNVPVDSTTRDYNEKMVQQFDEQVASYGFPWKLRGILPKCLVAGQDAGCLTEEGAKLLDVTGRLKAGIPMCPPEGDAGTGMVATNSVAKRYRKCFRRYFRICLYCFGKGVICTIF